MAFQKRRNLASRVLGGLKNPKFYASGRWEASLPATARGLGQRRKASISAHSQPDCGAFAKPLTEVPDKAEVILETMGKLLKQ
jgi:hypothetical protein